LVYILLSSITTFSRIKDENSNDKSLIVETRNEVAKKKFMYGNIVPINFNVSEETIK